MCGIAGFIQPASSGKSVEESRQDLERMLAQLARRGPDGEGVEIFEPRENWVACLGHRRLSIIDLEGGRQPMANEDESVWLTFNGEIFNFRELRDELIAKGHDFRTRSDSEVIVHLYEEEGPDGFCRLNGMFAFALWDRRDGSLTLARDRFGIKPLYFAELPKGGLAFGSELTALVVRPDVALDISASDLKSYFFSDYLIGPSTILSGVSKLLPGQYLVWRGGEVAVRRSFWAPWALARETEQARSEQEWIEAVRAALEHAVSQQLVADVPVGAFLSGGIDSSVITCMAAKHGPIQTFSMGFDQADFDESKWAKEVANQIGSEHFEQVVDEKLLLASLDDALDSLDEPLGDPSILPTFLVSKFAAGRVKVVIGGDGGDELFGGYPTYLAHKVAFLYGWAPAWIRTQLVERAIRALPASTSYMSLEWKLKRFALRWDDDPRRRHLRWMSSTDLGDIDAIFEESEAFEPPIFDYVSEEALAGRLSDWMLMDFTTYLPGSVLTKVDRASMANGLEVRPPFLDHDLVDLAFGMPDSLKVKGFTTKYLLRKVSEGIVPSSILGRQKQGFAIPVAAWLKGPLRERVQQLLGEGDFWEELGMRPGVLRSRFDEHLAGRENHSKLLWNCLVLHHWQNRMSQL